MAFKIAKIGKSINSNNPNDFIFHSDYNTFKIIKEGVKNVTLTASTTNQSFLEPHNIDTFIPLAHAFARVSGVERVFAPNGVDVEVYGAKLGFEGDIKFNYVATDGENILFNFDNNKTSNVSVYIKYYLLEKV